jgi:hypothetical protein
MLCGLTGLVTTISFWMTRRRRTEVIHHHQQQQPRA